MKKLLSLALALVLALSLFGFAEETEEATAAAIVYTNDVHCGVDDNLGYAGVKSVVTTLEGLGYDVFLVDCGDAIQGGPIGTFSDGEFIIDIMNYVGYDLATIGNHEFDYGMDRFMELVELADFPYISCNFATLDGESVLGDYYMAQLGGYNIAFIGVSTPETFTKSTPTYFEDEEGNIIYSFYEGENGQLLYNRVQLVVDSARAEGADVVIAMCHLGIDEVSMPYTSADLITNTTGIDVVLDAHSHTVEAGSVVLNKDGEEVLWTSTGTKLANIGVLIIDEEGTIQSGLIDTLEEKDADVAAFIDEINSSLEEVLSQVVAHTDVDLVVNDPETGVRLIRSTGTNLGDLCADAYRTITGADIAFVNGGGVRADIAAGDITYGQLLSVFPFGNALCVKEVDGQTILDALEHGARALPGELGGFLQVSGLTYTIDLNVDSTVVANDQNFFLGVTGDRRVKDVMVNGEPLDPEKVYTVASTDYILSNKGDGYIMFVDYPEVSTYAMLDNQVLVVYVEECLSGSVGEEYSDPYGEGRVTIIEKAE